MNELIPIDTEYKGCFFRSRLEARWAVFFEKMGWNWRYEVEGFQLPSGNYLPDFYFPDLKIYAEVKPQFLNKKEFRLCCELSEILSEGKQDELNVLLLEGDMCWKTQRGIVSGEYCQDVVPMPLDHRFYPFFYNSTFDPKYFDETADIITYARSARFEFEWKEK